MDFNFENIMVTLGSNLNVKTRFVVAFIVGDSAFS